MADSFRIDGLDNISLLTDLVLWISREPRRYDDVMDAWRTSCPRLSIWEDAIDRGFLHRYVSDSCVPMVCVTDIGLSFLRFREVL